MVWPQFINDSSRAKDHKQFLPILKALNKYQLISHQPCPYGLRLLSK